MTWMAFRVAFKDTFEWMRLARQVPNARLEQYGFLVEVPFLASVPVHVQLDLLAETWSRLVTGSAIEGSLLDECVLYAACETTARVVDEQPREFAQFLKGGPMQFAVTPDQWLVSRIRSLHLSMPIDGDFLAISQFEDMPPEESKKHKRRLGLNEDRLESMFEVLGRWHVSPNFKSNLSLLLSNAEIERVQQVLDGRGIPKLQGPSGQ